MDLVSYMCVGGNLVTPFEGAAPPLLLPPPPPLLLPPAAPEGGIRDLVMLEKAALRVARVASASATAASSSSTLAARSPRISLKSAISRCACAGGTAHQVPTHAPEHDGEWWLVYWCIAE